MWGGLVNKILGGDVRNINEFIKKLKHNPKQEARDNFFSHNQKSGRGL